MTTTTRSPRTRSLWSKWPATTISALTGLTALALVLATGRVEIDAQAPLEASTEGMAMPVAFEVAAPDVGFKIAAPESESAEKREMAARSAGILGVMAEEKGHFLASPYGGAFAVGSDDADVWGGLAGTEVGEAYGVGGLGLVGTGRGGGGTGEGTIGLGSGGSLGKGGSGSGYGRGAGSERRSRGSYNASLQSHVLTVGTVDDNADLAGYRKALRKLKEEGGMALGIDESLWQMAAPKQRHAAAPGGLDVALVIDTTGSMGDELEYLKVELRDIAREVSTSFPGVTQRWGLVVYRDRGDAYVTRSVDFRGIDEFITKLGEQEAGGGGDHPEAMDLAMDASAELSWRTGEGTARMV
ncbi:MAG TPA: VWA domain-containing protein, partial [Nannocystis sp.]